MGVLAPPSWRFPPRHYGAWETVAGNLANGLAARDHDVTLFASADSISSARVHAVVPRPWEEDTSLDPKVWEALHISEAMDRAAEFDIIHNHFDLLPLTYSRLIATPMVTTVHGFSLEQYRLLYRKYRASHFVSISDADRDPFLPYVATVYNGIDLGQFTYSDIGGDYLAFVGRIHPDKGVHLAVEAARNTEQELVIAGIIQDEQYFENLIQPHLGNEIRYIGPVGPEQRDAVLRGARGTLHLTTIPERFGLAMAESMACGTPVVGFDLGSVREVVEDAVTGFVVDTMAQAEAAILSLDTLDRRACRERVERLFSVETMVDGYTQVYRTILERGPG